MMARPARHPSAQEQALGLRESTPVRIAGAGAPVSVQANLSHPDGLTDGPSKSRADNFRSIPANGAVGDVLWVTSAIARTRRGLRLILRDVRKLKDWMVEREGFEMDLL